MKLMFMPKFLILMVKYSTKTNNQKLKIKIKIKLKKVNFNIINKQKSNT